MTAGQLPPAGGLVIQTAGLTRDFGPLRAVDGIDLAVPRGAVFGFLGPNGAGKTTTIRLLLGLLRPSAGHVRVLSIDLPDGGQAVRRRTGAVLEHHGLYEGLSVRATLEFAAQGYGTGRDAARRRVIEVVEPLGLVDRLDERPQSLSRGMRQRMAVARALLGDPDLLVLDEPTNGLDPEAAASLRHEILALAGGGTTVFLATHLLSEAERMCDLVAVVKQGRIIASGTPADLRRETRVHHVRVEGPQITATWAGLAAAQGTEWSAPDPDTIRVSVDGLAGVPAIVRALAHSGAAIHRVEPEGQTLEAAFLTLISAHDTQPGLIGDEAGTPPEGREAAAPADRTAGGAAE